MTKRKLFFKNTTPSTSCDHVQHHWLSDLSWKMQTVINQGFRAPDTHFCKKVKIICRWIRSVVLQNADKEHTFMCTKKEMPEVEELEHELNYCSVHFASHFLYALEIIGYMHPDSEIRALGIKYYEGITKDLWHFNCETKKQLKIRLADVDHTPVVKECPKEEYNDRYINYG